LKMAPIHKFESTTTSTGYTISGQEHIIHLKSSSTLENMEVVIAASGGKKQITQEDYFSILKDVTLKLVHSRYIE
jgi:hypothetical protein